jgi:hypothetical protein
VANFTEFYVIFRDECKQKSFQLSTCIIHVFSLFFFVVVVVSHCC